MKKKRRNFPNVKSFFDTTQNYRYQEEQQKEFYERHNPSVPRPPPRPDLGVDSDEDYDEDSDEDYDEDYDENYDEDYDEEQIPTQSANNLIEELPNYTGNKCPSNNKYPAPCNTKKDYIRQTLIFHPDKNTDCTKAATAKFQLLGNICKNVIKGGTKRQKNHRYTKKYMKIKQRRKLKKSRKLKTNMRRRKTMKRK